MIDFYRKSVLSQLGKDAGNRTMPDFVRNIVDNYNKYLEKFNEEKEKPNQEKTREDYDLYL